MKSEICGESAWEGEGEASVIALRACSSVGVHFRDLPVDSGIPGCGLWALDIVLLSRVS